MVHYLYWILPCHTPIVAVTFYWVLYHRPLFGWTSNTATLPRRIWSKMTCVKHKKIWAYHKEEYQVNM